MKRRIIHIDEEKCNGCGLCAKACHEGAIGMVHGKAKLLRDDYCDGLGDCLPTCPTGAIAFVEREAAAYDHAAVQENMKRQMAEQEKPLACGCPGSMARTIEREVRAKDVTAEKEGTENRSELRQWPVQIKLAPVKTGYFDGADLLIAADCTAYAHGDFHRTFIKDKVVLIGCPKLDEGDYAEKLTEILRNNRIKSVSVVRMEVPCCGGIVRAVTTALQDCGRMIPWQVYTIGTDGTIVATGM